MKRRVQLALVAVLVLTTAFATTAFAVADGGAQASTKKSQKKAGCKAKKGKGKAKGSAAVSAKKKGKGKTCKPKGKGKPTQAAPTPTPPGALPAVNWPLSDGTYDDAGPNSVTLDDQRWRDGGRDRVRRTLHMLPDHSQLARGPGHCTATSLQASGGISGGGGAIKGKWSITVTPDLKYELVTDSLVELPEQDPCSKTGVKLPAR